MERVVEWMTWVRNKAVSEPKRETDCEQTEGGESRTQPLRIKNTHQISQSAKVSSSFFFGTANVDEHLLYNLTQFMANLDPETRVQPWKKDLLDWAALSPVWRGCPLHRPLCPGGGMCVRNGGLGLCYVPTRRCPRRCPHWESVRCLTAEKRRHLVEAGRHITTLNQRFSNV